MNIREYSQEKDKTKPLEKKNRELNLRDVTVFEGVYDEYAPKLLKHAFFRTSSEQEAQDIVAQVFFKTWQYLTNPKNEIRDIKAFLYQLTNNLVVDYYRRRAKVQLVSLESIKSNIESRVPIYPFKVTEAKIDLEKVWQEVQALRDDYKTIIIWRYIDELSIKEISKLINKSRGATSIMIFRALKALKDKAEENEISTDN
jgi:RNA polymerase sigma-70 factor (ECF subfamily)